MLACCFDSQKTDFPFFQQIILVKPAFVNCLTAYIFSTGTHRLAAEKPGEAMALLTRYVSFYVSPFAPVGG